MVVHGIFQACFHSVIGMIRSAGGADNTVFDEQQASIRAISPALAEGFILSLRDAFSDTPKTLEVLVLFLLLSCP